VSDRSLRTLLARELAQTDTEDTRRLVAELRAVRRRGYMTKRELLEVCAWKSPRARRFCQKNSPEEVRRLSRRAFGSVDERERFHALTSLHGVGAPMASAILTLTDPWRYGVIDIRVWRALYKLGSVRTKPSGVGFTFEDWHRYLLKLREHAKELRVSVRRVEYSLFLYHKRTETGRLYRR
jgi:hypothetical protein